MDAAAGLAAGFQAAAVPSAAVERAGDGEMRQVMRSSFPLLFFSKAEKKAIVAAIRAAELQTSAEIRVHLQRRVRGDVMEAAEKTFIRLGMNSAKEKNAVLIFFETAGRRFSIVGGKAIHEQTPEGFWQEQAGRMETTFSRDRFADGLTQFIAEIGMLLALHFSRKTNDTNEFPDRISCSF